MARLSTTCDFCGQNDDHPKVHLGEVTKHHDCLSHSEEAALVGSAQVKGEAKVSAIIAACKDGKRGDALVSLIQSGDLAKAKGN